MESRLKTESVLPNLRSPAFPLHYLLFLSIEISENAAILGTDKSCDIYFIAVVCHSQGAKEVQKVITLVV